MEEHIKGKLFDLFGFSLAGLSFFDVIDSFKDGVLFIIALCILMIRLMNASIDFFEKLNVFLRKRKKRKKSNKKTE